MEKRVMDLLVTIIASMIIVGILLIVYLVSGVLIQNQALRVCVEAVAVLTFILYPRVSIFRDRYN